MELFFFKNYVNYILIINIIIIIQVEESMQLSQTVEELKTKKEQLHVSI